MWSNLCKVKVMSLIIILCNIHLPFGMKETLMTFTSRDCGSQCLDVLQQDYLRLRNNACNQENFQTTDWDGLAFSFGTWLLNFGFCRRVAKHKCWGSSQGLYSTLMTRIVEWKQMMLAFDSGLQIKQWPFCTRQKILNQSNIPNHDLENYYTKEQNIQTNMNGCLYVTIYSSICQRCETISRNKDTINLIILLGSGRTSGFVTFFGPASVNTFPTPPLV